MCGQTNRQTCKNFGGVVKISRSAPAGPGLAAIIKTEIKPNKNRNIEKIAEGKFWDFPGANF